MKNILLISLMILAVSCHKKKDEIVKPISKTAQLHIEYRATNLKFAVDFHSYVQVIIGGIHYDKVSAYNKDNIVIIDMTIQGDQDIVFFAEPVDPQNISCGAYDFIPVTGKVVFNGKTLYSKSLSSRCGGTSLAYTGRLEFIN